LIQLIAPTGPLVGALFYGQVIQLDYLAVAAAGFLGTVTRAILGKLMQTGFDIPFPVGTLVINLTGCFILSFFLHITIERLTINPRLRLAVGTGFLGAYTTFSTFAVESINLLRTGHPWLSLAYILSTSLGCILLAWIGAVLSRAVTTTKRRKELKEENQIRSE